MLLKHNRRAVSFVFLAVVTAEFLQHGRQLLDEASPLHFSRPYLPAPRPSFELKIRSASTATVDIASMPTCVQSSCLASPAPYINCPSIDAPCPSDAESTTCVTYPLDCYCGLTTPLTCAWDGCGWLDWMFAEDWFADICPSAPNMSFNGLPSCAQSCMMRRSFDYGCITYAKNCFCNHGSLFGCDTYCTQAQGAGPNGQIAMWYASQCNVSLDTANAALGTLNSTVKSAKGQEWNRIPGRPLHWDEIMAIAVAFATFAALVLVLVVLTFTQKRAAKEREQMRQHRAAVKEQEEKKRGRKNQEREKQEGVKQEGVKKRKGFMERIRDADVGLRSRIEKLLNDDAEEKEGKEENDENQDTQDTQETQQTRATEEMQELLETEEIQDMSGT